ncbi:MAG: hypothetical protein RL662_1021 [Bacteroidota bacterium]|jgi:hypothetical protein
MKKYILIVLCSMLVGIGKAQIGINTKIPHGVFHIDTKGDTDHLGNNSIDDVVIDSIGNIGIGTLTPQAKLDINGKLRIGDAPRIGTNVEVLVRNVNTGQVGTAITLPTRVAFMQSEEAQQLTLLIERNEFNAGIPFVVRWSNTDIISNNVVQFDPINHVFTITEKGLYELSGYINYLPGASIPTTYTTVPDAARAAVNTTIQVDLNDGKGWVDFTGSRAIFGGNTVSNTAQTTIVPPGVSLFEAGTKIRMIFRRPTNFGLPHGTSAINGIEVPSGLKFSKGFKILAR